MLAKAKKNLGHLADKKVEAFLELADKEHDKILKEEPSAMLCILFLL